MKKEDENDVVVVKILLKYFHVILHSNDIHKKYFFVKYSKINTYS